MITTYATGTPQAPAPDPVPPTAEPPQAAVPPPGATVALANNTIGAGPTNAMDVTNILNVSMVNGDISSVTELALFNGANLFAYGEPGRWEIIGARTVTLQGDGTYNLSTAKRRAGNLPRRPGSRLLCSATSARAPRRGKRQWAGKTTC
jgi:hypothetical protein